MTRFWDRSEYWIRKGDAARASQSWAIAARCYRKALKHRPDLAPIWVQYGHALKENGKLSAAEAAYRRSLEISPYVADTHLQLGHLQKVQGNIADAAESYAEALRRDHGLVDAERELRLLGRDADVQKLRHEEVVPAPLADQIASHYWWHSIDLGNGIITPGMKSPVVTRSYYGAPTQTSPRARRPPHHQVPSGERAQSATCGRAADENLSSPGEAACDIL
jgi:tetratricopeptide (TPR) repeat protein